MEEEYFLFGESIEKIDYVLDLLDNKHESIEYLQLEKRAFEEKLENKKSLVSFNSNRIKNKKEAEEIYSPYMDGVRRAKDKLEDVKKLHHETTNDYKEKQIKFKRELAEAKNH